MSEQPVKIESEANVKTYIQKLKYALDHGAKISFQIERRVDEQRKICYTNKFTVAELFPSENPVEALKRELKTITVENYLRTVKDFRFSDRSDMWEFGKIYNGKDVYIKIRVELLSPSGFEHTAFVMSFHFAEYPFKNEDFPYRKK